MHAYIICMYVGQVVHPLGLLFRLIDSRIRRLPERIRDSRSPSLAYPTENESVGRGPRGMEMFEITVALDIYYHNNFRVIRGETTITSKFQIAEIEVCVNVRQRAHLRGFKHGRAIETIFLCMILEEAQNIQNKTTYYNMCGNLLKFHVDLPCRKEEDFILFKKWLYTELVRLLY